MKKTTRSKMKGNKINYPIGDFLVRLKNAIISGNTEVSVPKTKLIKAVVDVMKKEGFFTDVKSDEKQLTVTLAIRRKEPVLMDVKLVSKPGLRVYMKVDELDSLRGPFMVILSTPMGIMSGREAIKKKMGGEVIAKLY